jgi:FkbM family methyltransferase
MPITQTTPFRQMFRIYEAYLSIAHSLARLSAAMDRLALAKAAAPTSGVTETGVPDVVEPGQTSLRLLNRMGFDLILDETSIVDKTVIEQGIWEDEQLSYLRSLIERLRGKPDMQFLDIGSYWGLYSLVALRTGAFAKLDAFEADIDNFAQLQANLFLNRATHEVKAHNIAISDQVATLRFWDSRTHPNGNRAGVGFTSEDSGNPNYAVQAVPMDTLITVAGAHIVMKIDVEGHEEAVLRGMAKLVAANQIVMQIEVFTPQYEKVFAQTESLGLRKIQEIYPDHYFTNMTMEQLGV